jgi:hypothetical protein
VSRDGSITESSCSLKLQLRGFRICHEIFSSCRGPARSTLRKRGAAFSHARVELRFSSVLDEDSPDRQEVVSIKDARCSRSTQTGVIHLTAVKFLFPVERRRRLSSGEGQVVTRRYSDEDRFARSIVVPGASIARALRGSSSGIAEKCTIRDGHLEEFRIHPIPLLGSLMRDTARFAVQLQNISHNIAKYRMRSYVCKLIHIAVQRVINIQDVPEESTSILLDLFYRN